MVGVTSASAATRSACSGVTPKAPTTDPSNPFGPNVTIFDASESVSTINAALSAHYTPANHEFFFLPGTYGDASATPATATTSNTVRGRLHAAGRSIPLELDATVRSVEGGVEIEAITHAPHHELGMTWSPLGMARPLSTLIVKGRLVRKGRNGT